MMTPPLHDAGPHKPAGNSPEEILEATGRRLAAYLRHYPLPERSRHELTLEVLNGLAADFPDGGFSIPQAMQRLRDQLLTYDATLRAQPAPALVRSHMCPEEMDRRPWVRTWLRTWHPLYAGGTYFFNSRLLDMLLYALLLGGLYYSGLRPN